MWQKKGSDLCCPRYIPKISCRLGSLLSRVQKVFTCFVWGPIINQSGWLWVDSPPTSLQLHLSQDQPISHNKLDLSYKNSSQQGGDGQRQKWLGTFIFLQMCKIVPKLFQNCPDIVFKLSQRCLKVVSKMSHSCLKELYYNGGQRSHQEKSSKGYQSLDVHFP